MKKSIKFRDFISNANIINDILYILLPAIMYAKICGVKIGKNCRIVTKNFGSEPYLIEIGNHVHLTKGVSFVTHDGGVWVFRNQEKDFDIFGKILLKDNIFIGNNSVLLPGITIGNNCIIGANSVVSKSIPDNSVVAGNPAIYIKNTQSYLNNTMKYNLNTKSLCPSKKKEVLLQNNVQFIQKEYLKIDEERV
jgi:acetyltransferase-like isoleucine patch superfamily enzyme